MLQNPAAQIIRLVAGILIFSLVPATGFADCHCYGNGRKNDLGAIVCLTISPTQQYLARCEMVANNTGWSKLQDGCPSAHIDLEKTKPHQQSTRPSGINPEAG